MAIVRKMRARRRRYTRGFYFLVDGLERGSFRWRADNRGSGWGIMISE